jgi:hypothetical protein
MDNNHNVDSQITSTYNFESKINNRHSFASKIINSRLYEVIVSSFTSTNSWFAKFINNNIITNTSIKSIGNLYTVFISNSLMTVKTLINITGVFTIKFVETNTIKAIIKSSQNMGTATVILANKIVARMSSLFRITSANNIASHNIIAATIIGRKYYLLSDWDSYNMSDLDAMNLSAMDYFSDTGFTAFYVDNAATGTGTGLSWVNAWASFAAINWTTLQNAVKPVLYISGGASSKTYLATLAVGKSGTIVSPICIDVGANSPSPSGHSGQVIIDGGGTRTSGIYSEGKNYIHINGLSGVVYNLLIQNTVTGADGDAAVVLRDGIGLYADYIKIDNAKNRGVFFYTVTNGRVRGCDIRTGDVDNAYQTDCIYVGRGTGNFIENNYCLLGNNWTTGHVDVLQIVGDDGLTIRNNWLEWHNGRGVSGNQTLIMEETTGNIFIYNNVMWGCSVASNLMMKDATSGMTYILNNTMIAQNPTGKALLLMYPDEDQIGLIQNNILYSQNEIPLYCNQVLALTGKINNNCLYRSTGTDISYLNGATHTWAQHQSAGYDINGVNANPLFVTNFSDLHLQAGSPCRHEVTLGADLSAYFTTDKDGVFRPVAQWDIGAYQY